MWRWMPFYQTSSFPGQACLKAVYSQHFHSACIQTHVKASTPEATSLSLMMNLLSCHSSGVWFQIIVLLYPSSLTTRCKASFLDVNVYKMKLKLSISINTLVQSSMTDWLLSIMWRNVVWKKAQQHMHFLRKLGGFNVVILFWKCFVFVLLKLFLCFPL